MALPAEGERRLPALLDAALIHDTAKLPLEFLGASALGRLACCCRYLDRHVMRAPCHAWNRACRRYSFAPLRGRNAVEAFRALATPTVWMDALTEDQNTPGTTPRPTWRAWIRALQMQIDSEITPGHFLQNLVEGALAGPVVKYHDPGSQVTPIWYRCVTAGRRWEWSPDESLWIPVASNMVPSGPWMGLSPAPVNLAIIEFLHCVQPPPPPLAVSDISSLCAVEARQFRFDSCVPNPDQCAEYRMLADEEGLDCAYAWVGHGLAERGQAQITLCASAPDGFMYTVHDQPLKTAISRDQVRDFLRVNYCRTHT